MSARLANLFEEDGLKCRVQLLRNVFQQTWLSKTHCIFQASQKVLVRKLYHIQAILLFLKANRLTKKPEHMGPVNAQNLNTYVRSTHKASIQVTVSGVKLAHLDSGVVVTTEILRQ